MKHLLVIVLFITGWQAQAQFDTPSGGIAIPKTSSPSISPKPAETPSGYVSPFKITPPKKETKPLYQIGGDNSSNSSVLQTENKYVTGGSEYKDRVTVKPRGESSEAFKGNMDFGIIRTKSGTIVLTARDFGAEDGDRVKVTQNDKIIVSDAMLTNNGKGITITLQEGFNDIRVEALNQGTSGPNTGAFAIFDNKEEKLTGSEWNLATGFYAKFLIIKE